MSLLRVVPEAVATASSNLESVGSTLRSASDAAMRRTTAIAPPGADEISSAITRLFGSHGQEFAAVNARASVFHAEFVKLLNGGALQYVNAEIANVRQTLTTALAGAATVNPAAAISEVSSIDTPFGPVAVTQTFSFPDTGNGPLSAGISATTPFGPASFSIAGNMTTTPTSPTTAQAILSLTGGAIVVPPQVRLLVGAAGPLVTGGFSLFDSYNAFSSALTGGNIVGAATTFLRTPFDWTNAVLFGRHSVTLPLGQLGGLLAGPEVSLRIPFGGLFAPSAPLTMSVPQYSVTDSVSGLTQTWAASDFAFAGSQFGGLGTELLKTIGLPL